jgi:hypothetical protein
VRTFTVRAQETNATCQGYSNWDVLYREAVRGGDDRIERFACRDGCVRNPWIARQQAGCDEFNSPFVEIFYAVTCRRESEAVIDGLPFKDPDQINGPFKEEVADVNELPASTEQVRSSLFADPDARVCPYTFYFSVDLEINIGAAAAVADYAPYIARAREQAQALWEATRCPLGCTKQALAEEYVRWSSRADAIGATVVVSSEWSVPCTGG